MFDLPLTRPPDSLDQFGPIFRVSQIKGLREVQDNRLLEGALEEGFTQFVAESLFSWVREVATQVAPSQGALRVVELGGGSGQVFDFLSSLSSYFVDVDPADLTNDRGLIARSKDDRFQLLRCSAEDVPLPDGWADLVVAVASLDHVPNYRGALREASRLLRSGGVLVLTVNNRRSWWKVLLGRTAALKRREQFIATQHYFQWDVSECEKELGRVFERIEVTTGTYLPYLPRISRSLMPLADWIGKRLAPRRGGNILARASKD